MKIAVNSSDLLRVISICAKAILSKNSLSIFDSVLITCTDKAFSATGGSHQSTITLPLPMEVVEGKAADFKPIAIRPQQLLPFLSSLSSTPLTIIVDYNEAGAGFLTMKHSKGHVSVPFESGAEYPNDLRITDPVCTLANMPADIVLGAISTAKNFCATDELRMVLNGVFIDARQDEVAFVGTNGTTLYRYILSNKVNAEGKQTYEYQSTEVNSTCILHTSVISPLIPAFSKAEILNIAFSSNRINIYGEGVNFVGVLTEGRFPNYKAVIPTDSDLPHRLLVNVKELMQVLKRVAPFGSDASKLAKLSNNGMFPTISAEDLDMATSANEDITAIENTMPQGYAIGFNSQVMMQSLQTITTDSAAFYLGEPSRPIIIKNDDPNSPVTTLIMPQIIM